MNGYVSRARGRKRKREEKKAKEEEEKNIANIVGEINNMEELHTRSVNKR